MKCSSCVTLKAPARRLDRCPGQLARDDAYLRGGRRVGRAVGPGVAACGVRVRPRSRRCTRAAPEPRLGKVFRLGGARALVAPGKAQLWLRRRGGQSPEARSGWLETTTTPLRPAGRSEAHLTHVRNFDRGRRYTRDRISVLPFGLQLCNELQVCLRPSSSSVVSTLVSHSLPPTIGRPWPRSSLMKDIPRPACHALAAHQRP